MPKPPSPLEELFYSQCLRAGEAPSREVTLIPRRRSRSDFAWLEEMIIVEIEGGTWVNNWHGSPVVYADNCVKYNSLQLLGYIVLRYTTNMVRSGEAIEQVLFALEKRRKENCVVLHNKRRQSQ